MGRCVYCGEQTRFLSKSHKACLEKHEQGKKDIVNKIKVRGFGALDVEGLDKQIQAVAKNSFLDASATQQLVIQGWEAAVEAAFEDGVLEPEEESALFALMNHFSLTQQQLDRNGAFSRVVKGTVLREVLNGKLPEAIQFHGNIPFNFQKSEQLVWMFEDVDYFEDRTRTHYVGGSQGFSVRIAQGVYFRTGGFRGERVQTTETEHRDTGLMAVTTKHIYFAGSRERFRIAFRKIVCFEPFEDGIGVQRDAKTAKPQSFRTGDGWFAYNLISNVAQM